MSDNESVVLGGGENLFDPSSFVTKTALNGRRGVIREAAFIRHNYGKPGEDSASALRLVVVSPDLEKPRVLLIAMGDVWPSTDGRTKSTSGNFIAGKIDKNSNLAMYLNNLKAAGFQMALMGAKGAAALENADFTWKAVEKKVSGEFKAYDVPSEFHGYAAPLSEAEKTAIFAGQPQGGGQEAAAPGGNGAVAASAEPEISDEELQSKVRLAVAQTVQENGGELARGQLSIKVGPKLAGIPRKTDALQLMIQDDFLGSIPGVTYDKKTLKTTQPAAAVAQ